MCGVSKTMEGSWERAVKSACLPARSSVGSTQVAPPGETPGHDFGDLGVTVALGYFFQTSLLQSIAGVDCPYSSPGANNSRSSNRAIRSSGANGSVDHS